MLSLSWFCFNDTATTEIYTLSLHDALPICAGGPPVHDRPGQRHQVERVDAGEARGGVGPDVLLRADRKSTRLNSSHANISYAVFCLKKKNTTSSSYCPQPRLTSMT